MHGLRMLGLCFRNGPFMLSKRSSKRAQGFILRLAHGTNPKGISTPGSFACLRARHKLEKPPRHIASYHESRQKFVMAKSFVTVTAISVSIFREWMEANAGRTCEKGMKEERKLGQVTNYIRTSISRVVKTWS